MNKKKRGFIFLCLHYLNIDHANLQKKKKMTQICFILVFCDTSTAFSVTSLQFVHNRREESFSNMFNAVYDIIS